MPFFVLPHRPFPEDEEEDCERLDLYIREYAYRHNQKALRRYYAKTFPWHRVVMNMYKFYVYETLEDALPEVLEYRTSD